MRIKGIKIDEDVAKILNEQDEQDNNFPPGSFAAWYGEDLTGQTYTRTINCSYQGLTSLFGCPSKVTESFDCHGNKLTSLEGAPEKVGGDFRCYDNKLTSLEGAPKEVEVDFDCHSNKLTSLEGAPEKVRGYFECGSNQLTTLKGAPKEVGGSFYCYNNQLITLKGAPKEVGGDFYCFDNELTSLEGAPEKVGGYFDCRNNQLTTLKGAPKEVGKGFYCPNNRLTSLNGAPEYVGGHFDCRNNPNLKSLEGIGKVKREIISDLKSKKDTKSKKKSPSQSNLSTLDEIKDYMEESGLEEYNLTHNEVEFTFNLEDDELSFEFDGPIWSSDSSEILEDIIKEGDLDNITEYIIEEGEEFTPPGQFKFEDEAYYRTDSGEIIQYIAMRNKFYTLDKETVYNADDFKKSDLEYIGELDEDEI